jgi:hypothetical protein
MSIKPLSALTLEDKDVTVQVQWIENGNSGELKTMDQWSMLTWCWQMLWLSSYMCVCTAHLWLLIHEFSLFHSLTMQGNAIYAEIPNDLVQQKSSFFEIKKVYNVKRFRVASARWSFKVVDNPPMLYITPYIVIELCHNPPSTFPEYVYRLTAYDHIDPYGPRSRDFHGEYISFHILTLLFFVI